MEQELDVSLAVHSSGKTNCLLFESTTCPIKREGLTRETAIIVDGIIMADDNRPRIPASEILAKIEKGEPVEYDNVIIDGDINIHGLNTIIRHSEGNETQDLNHLITNIENSYRLKITISITNSEIQGSLDLSNSILSNNVDLSGTKIVGYADLIGTIFSGVAEFTGAIFGGYADLRGAAFGGNTNLAGAKFEGLADFKDAIFNENIDFGGAEFNGHAQFDRAIFNRDANFDLARIKGNAGFCEAIFKKDASFTRAIFSGDARFSRIDINEDVSFGKTTFSGYADFNGAILNGHALFIGAKFEAYADFRGVIFGKYAVFSGYPLYGLGGDARFSDHAIFEAASFEVNADFGKATFNNYADFRGVNFVGPADFISATFRGDSAFKGSSFFGEARFRGARLVGDILTFRDANFQEPRSQEDACRRAKILLEKNGNREEAGYHFYREMEAKRKLKPSFISYPELVFIQWVFGYGVHPLRLWACWLGFVGIFAVIYGLGHGIDATASQMNAPADLKDYLWFSIATAVTPGYAGYKPTPDFKLVAGLEAIIGTFMWAAFIATFSRKYMR